MEKKIIFRPGDKVVFLYEGSRENSHLALDDGKVYTIKKTFKINNIYKFDTNHNMNVKLEEHWGLFHAENFISLLEYRKQKIEKICSRLGMM